MDLEKLALMGIALFAFMALAAVFTTMRTIKRIARGPIARPKHRPIRSEESARMVALSVVGEIAHRKPQEVAISREQGQLTEDLENALQRAEDYFSDRVDSRHFELFYEAIDKLILNKSREE